MECLIKTILLSKVIFLTFVSISFGANNSSDLKEQIYQVGMKSVANAKSKLSIKVEDRILVITNAGFVKLLGNDTSSILMAIEERIQASVGKGNLFKLREGPTKPLFVFFYNSKNDKGYYLQWSAKASSSSLTPSIEVVESGFRNLLNSCDLLEKRMNERIFGGNEFRVSMITWAWNKGISDELKSAIEFHDHLCPGVTSGYYIAKYLKDHFPLSEGQKYYIISSPSYCKDDVLQAVLNTTVGKNSMAVIPMKKEDINCLKEDVRSVTGIYFRYNRDEKTGDGIVLSFLWDKLRENAGISVSESEQSKRPSLSETIKLLSYMIEKEHEFADYVRPIKYFNLDCGLTPEDYVRPGVNPWEKLGIWICK